MSEIFDIKTGTEENNFTTQPSVGDDFNNDATLGGGERFYIEELNIDINAQKATLHGGVDTQPFTSDAWAEIYAPVSWAQSTFLWQGDAIDTNDTNRYDNLFRVHAACNSTGIEDTSLGVGSGLTTALTTEITADQLKFINPRNIIPSQARVYHNAMQFYGNSVVNTVSNNMKVSPDFLRYIGFKLFGVSTTDLFNNETSTKVDIDQKSHEAFVKQMIKLANFRHTHGVETTSDYVRWNDISLPEDALTQSLYNNFPTKAIIKQMLDNVRSRFSNLPDLVLGYNPDTGAALSLGDGNIYDANGLRVASPDANTKIWLKTPFKVGDMLFFQLSITPHEDQNNVLGEPDTSTNTDFLERTYRIRIVLVDDADDRVNGNGNIAGDDITGMTYNTWTSAGWADRPPYYTDAIGSTTV